MSSEQSEIHNKRKAEKDLQEDTKQRNISTNFFSILLILLSE